MEKKFTPISEIKKKIDDNTKTPLLNQIKDFILSIIIPIISFIIVVNPIVFKQIIQNSDLEFSSSDFLKTTGVFSIVLLITKVINYFGGII